jgi:DNA end-binding protein Ku
MRALWKGSIAFGLVNVPVKMYAATEDHDVRFHQVHAKDGGRIRMKRQCEVCGEQLSFSEIAKGYEDASGQRLIIDPEDLESLPVPGGRDIDVVEFVPNEQIDPILFDRCYYLEPESRAVKPYVLLREALAETERTALVKVAIRQRTQLACLRIRDDVVVLQTMKWPDEIRAARFEFLDNDVEVRRQELDMAESLIETMSGDFDPEEYTDDYREALLALIDAKLAGGKGIEVPEVSETEDSGQVVDLMAALRESVARSQAKRSAEMGDTGTPATDEEVERPEAPVAAAEVPAEPAARRRAATGTARKSAKAAPARRAAAKKAPAKKAAAGRKSAAKAAPAKKSSTPAKRRSA